MLQVQNIEKYYGSRNNVTKALDRVSFDVADGEFMAVMGASGSGKTTLLNCISTIDTVSAGDIFLDGENIAELPAGELARFRRERLGFVFQDFNLLDTMSLKDNIFLPLVLAGGKYENMEKRLVPLAKKLGIYELLDKYPYEVSGGQKQRAAVCRALITQPDIILADEPTGALDSKASGKLLKLFGEINGEGQTILMVTHSIQAASHAGRVLFIKDGCIFHQIYKGNQNNDAMYRMISDALTVLQAEKGESAERGDKEAEHE